MLHLVIKWKIMNHLDKAAQNWPLEDTCIHGSCQHSCTQRSRDHRGRRGSSLGSQWLRIVSYNEMNRCHVLAHYQRTTTVLDSLCHNERLSDGILHSCPVWLHMLFWPWQRRSPALTSTFDQDVLPPGQRISPGKILNRHTIILQNLQRNRANFIPHTVIVQFVTIYLHVI